MWDLNRWENDEEGVYQIHFSCCTKCTNFTPDLKAAFHRFITCVQHSCDGLDAEPALHSSSGAQCRRWHVNIERAISGAKSLRWVPEGAEWSSGSFRAAQVCDVMLTKEREKWSQWDRGSRWKIGRDKREQSKYRGHDRHLPGPWLTTHRRGQDLK